MKTIPIPAPEQIGNGSVCRMCSVFWLAVAFDGVKTVPTDHSQDERLFYTAKPRTAKGRFCKALAAELGTELKNRPDGALDLWRIALWQDEKTATERAAAWERAAIKCGYEIEEVPGGAP